MVCPLAFFKRFFSGKYLRLWLCLVVLSVFSPVHAQVFYAVSDGSNSLSNDQLRSVNVDGTNDRLIAAGFTNNIGVIAVDRVNKQVFVSNGLATGGAIYKIGITSGAVTTFVTTSSIVQGMAVDNKNNYLYYTVSDNNGSTTIDQLRRINLSGTNDVLIAADFASSIGDVALDLVNSRAFVGDRSTSVSRIYSTNLNSGATSFFVSIPTGFAARGLAVDPVNSYLYYAFNDISAASRDEVRRIDLSGSNDVRIATDFVTGIGEIAFNPAESKLVLADNNGTNGVIKQISVPANTTATFFTPSNATVVTGIDLIPCSSGFTVNSTLDVADANPGDGVCRTADGVCTLRAAIQEANALPTCGPMLITLPAGQTIGLSAALPDLTFSGTIAGGSVLCPSAGTGGSTISRTGGTEFGIFYQTSGNLTLKDLVITNGNAPSGNDIGGGIASFSSCTLIVDRCVLRNNTAGVGGGIYALGALVNVNETYLDDNAAALGGAIAIRSQGVVVLTNSSIRDEAANNSILLDNRESSLLLRNAAIGGNGSVLSAFRVNSAGQASSLSVIHSTFNLPRNTYLIEAYKNTATQTVYLQNNVFVNAGSPFLLGGSSGSLNISSGGGNVFAGDAEAANISGAAFTPVASDKQNVGATALALGSFTTISGECLPVIPLGCFSPAINAAVSSTVTTDMLGNSQVGAARDAGSLESTNAASVTFTVAGSGTACAGRALTLTASGCTGGTVSWPGGITGNVYSTTLAGMYTATCTIGACSTTASGTITAGAAPAIAIPVLSMALVSTALANALSFTASGAGAPFTFAYSALPPGITLSSNASPILTFNGTPTQAGTYPISVTATNSNGCTTVSNAYTLTVSCPTMGISTSANPGTCQGTGSLTFITGLPTGSYSLSYTGAGSPKTVTVSGGRFTVTGLLAGTYSNFAINYGSGACLLTDNRSITLTDPASPTIAITANLSGSLTCSQTTLTLTATGASSYTFAGPGIVSQNAAAGTALVNTAGVYSVTGSNAAGCRDTDQLTVTGSTTAPTGVGLSASQSGTLTCTNRSLTLTASATGSGLSYDFSGPGVLAQSGVSATVNAAGTYTVVVTGSNGCTASATTTVYSNTAAPVVILSPVNATLTCASPTVTLTATAGYVNYAFSGGQTGSGNTLAVTSAGTYSVVVTGANGCTASTSVSVQSSTAVISASLTAGGAISCPSPSVTLTASPSNLTYSFGGGASQIGQTNQAVANVAGLYSVTVSDASGCTAVAQLTVTGSTTAPTGVGLSASQSGTLTCTNRSLTLTASATGSGLSYDFSGPGVLAQSGSSATVNAAGTYTVVVTGSNGCTASATTTVYSNTAAPVVILSPVNATLTCASPTVTLTATAGYVNYAFSGGQTGSGNTLAVTSAGTYSVVVTGANGCTASTSVSVQSSTAVISASLTAGGAISCPSPSVTLTASPSNLTYSFGGGASQIGQTNQAVANVAGLYSVTVSDASGCTAVAQVTVTGSTTAPTGVGLSASQSGTLTCTNRSLTLTASATGSGLSYAFSGPGVLAQSGVSATVNAAGTYTVVVTGSNGCTASATTTVYSNTAAPVVTFSPVNATLTCASPTVTLTATAGYVNYAFSSGQNGSGNTLAVTSAGTYSVVVTGANGCTASTSVSVQSSTAVISASLTASGIISCPSPSVTLTASPSSLTYRFGGGASQVGQTNQAVASVAGLYSVTVSDASGCTAVAQATVTGSTTAPTGVGLSASQSGTLTCTNRSLTLTASATGSGLSYAFSGPGVLAQSGVSATVNAAGTYTVVVTGSNGCTASATTTVYSNTAAPAVTLTPLNATVTCASPTVTLTATAGYVNYAFSGGQTGSGNTLAVTSAGTYSVVVTGANGCTASTSVSVQSSTAVISASLTAGGAISCPSPSVTLTASPSNLTYSFGGGASQIGQTNQAVANVAGLYSVTVSDASGCTAVAQVTVTGSTTAPTGVGLSASQSGTLTCTNRSLTLTASATGSGLSYAFSGPGVLAQSGVSATVNAAGTYTVVVTGSNGCTASATTTVYSNTTAPAVTLTPSSATLTCASPTVTLTATAGYVNYAFSGGQTGSGNTLAVSSVGTYSVVVTGANGCTASTSVSVQSSTAVLSASLTAGGAISCPSPSVTLTASPSNLTYSFGGGASQIGQTNQAVANVAGLYSVTVSDASGCTAVAQVTVTASTTAPTGVGLSASQSGTLTCTNRSLTLTASATGSGLSYAFSGPGVLAQSGVSATVNAAGTYTVVVTGSNGCTASTTTTVYSNTAAPVVTLTPSSATLTCASPTVTLTATAGYVNYAFSGGQTGSGNTLAVSSVGTYSVVVTGANGCTASTSVSVQSSTTAPAVSITPMNATLTCASPTVILTAIGSGTAVWSTNVTSNTLLVSTPGLYSVTLTNASGCSATASTQVSSNTVPAGLTATVSGALGCGVSSVQLLASAPGAASFTVVGPSSYQQTNTNGQFTVNTAGQYTVTAIGTGGCVSTTTVTVTSGGVQPVASNFVAGGVLSSGTCQLNLSAAIVGDRAVVTGPGGYVFTNVYRTPAARVITAPAVKQPGSYTLKVYSGNCEAVYTVNVTGSACQE